ncbi:MAG: mechanosensitive ion channel family protein [Rugosibacter sp.]
MFEYFYTGLHNHLETILRVALILILWSVALRVIHRGIPRLREALVSRQADGESGQRIRTLSRVVRYALTVATTVVAGLVEELTLRYLKLRDYSGNVHFIPNGNITTVTNMSMGFAYAVIDASIAYGEDIDQAISVMRRTGEEIRVDPAFADKFLEPLEIAGVENWADSAVVIRCRFKVAPLAQWDVRREYLRRLKNAFDQDGIEIPYPHMKVFSCTRPIMLQRDASHLVALPHDFISAGHTTSRAAPATFQVPHPQTRPMTKAGTGPTHPG